jgi:hypothetical protein
MGSRQANCRGEELFTLLNGQPTALRSKKRPPFGRFVAESGFYRLDLYANQNRLEHKNLHRERDNCTV